MRLSGATHEARAVARATAETRVTRRPHLASGEPRAVGIELYGRWHGAERRGSHGFRRLVQLGDEEHERISRDLNRCTPRNADHLPVHTPNHERRAALRYENRQDERSERADQI